MEEDKYVPSRKIEQDYKIVLQFGKERLAKGRNEGGLRKQGWSRRDRPTGQDTMCGVIFPLRPGVGGG